MVLKDKKILLLGGLGFIGKNLYIRLNKSGYYVDMFSNTPPENNDPFMKITGLGKVILGDIRNKELLEKMVPEYDVIFSLAGLSGAKFSLENPFLDNEINCVGHLNLLEACRKYNNKIQIIFTSSRLVYGKPRYLPVDEKHPLCPQSFYAIHKLTAEYYYQLYFRLYGLKSIILRISNPFGPFQQFGHHKYGILNWFMYLALSGEPITLFGDGSQKRDYLFIDDLTDLLVLLLDRSEISGKIFNVGAGHGISLIDSIATIKKFIPNLISVSTSWPTTDKDIETGDYVTDITKIKNSVGWRPVITFQDGIQQTIKFYQNYIH